MMFAQVYIQVFQAGPWCVTRWLDLMGEQGGESIHNRFNRLRDSLNKTKDVDQRLQFLVKEYILG